MMNFKSYLSILISSVTFFSFQSAWAGKTEYDIPCEKQIFNDPLYNRDTVHLSCYTPDAGVNEQTPAVVFFHGAPGLMNEGQFDQFFAQFTNNGFKVYVPEIIGSSYYNASGMDANEYKKNYCTDIQAVINHIEKDSLGKKYAISHSLGCHQLFHFMSHPETQFTFDVVSAIAGPWDVGANRLNIVAPNWRTDFERNKSRIMYTTRSSFVGEYALLESHEAPLTEVYNPVVSKELNTRFSVLDNMAHLPKMPPVLLMHAKDDKQVGFSLSLDMFAALKKNANNVSGYFLSTGDHGFIKNPLDSEVLDTNLDLREKAVENMLKFFQSPDESVYFDNQAIEFSEITADLDFRQVHEEFLNNLQR